MRSPILSLAAGLALALSAQAQPYVGPLPGGHLVYPPRSRDTCSAIQVAPLTGPRSGSESFCVGSQLQCNDPIELAKKVADALCAKDRAICAKGTSLCSRKAECTPRVKAAGVRARVWTWARGQGCGGETQCRVTWQIPRGSALQCGCGCRP